MHGVMPRGAHDPSEFETVFAAVLPLLKGQGSERNDLPIWALEPAGVVFLAGETGLNRAQLDSLVQGFKLAQARESSDVPPAAFYGWFRSGMPLDPTRLWRHPPRICSRRFGPGWQSGSCRPSCKEM
jgi:hypothetical protein